MSLPIPSGQYPDEEKDTIMRMRNASAMYDFRNTSANPRLWRRRSHRRPRRRKVAPEVKWLFFQLFVLFRACVFVGLVTFLYSKGMNSPVVLVSLANMVWQMIMSMPPPPPSSEDDGSNYTLQA